MARGNSLGSATIQLELEYAKVSKGIDQVNKKLGDFQKGLKRMSGVLKTAFGVASVYAFSRALGTTLTELDKIGKTAAKIGVTTEALQELRFAAEQSGVNVQALDMGMQRFVRRTAEAARGTGVLATEFSALDISLQNADGSMRGVEAVLGDYADAIANAKDSQEQLRLAFKAFDSEGAALVNLFRRGKIGVDELRQELRDLGGVIDDNLIKRAEDANDAMNRVSKAIGGAMTTALAKLAPIIERVANWIVKLAKRWRTFWESTVPLADLSIRQLQQQLESASAEVGKWQSAIDEHNRTLQEPGGGYKVLAANLAIYEQRLEAARARVREVSTELDKAERTGRALTDANDALSGSLADVGTGSATAARALKELSAVAGGSALNAIDEFRASWADLLSTLESRTTATMTDVLDLWDRLDESMTGAGANVSTAIDDATDSLFDMKEAVLDVQENIQQGFSDLFFDVFDGKGIDSVKDFAKRVLDIFKRLFADIAAAWVASKIFKLPGNFGVNLGGLINGGGIGGAIGQGTGLGGSVISGGVGKAISSGLGKIGSAIKGLFGGGAGATTGGLFGGSVTPASLVASSGGGPAWMAGAGGLAALAGIGVLGFSRLSAKRAQRRENQQQFFGNVGTGTFDALNPGSAFRGFDETTGEFFVTLNEGWSSTIKALKEANALIEAQGAMYDERGNELVKIAGNADQVKAALSGAATTGFEFAGSLGLAIEKGNSLRVSVQGDAQAIQDALSAATAMGIGGFRDLETTATGVSATLTGDLQRWNDFLQQFVNVSIRDAINGVGDLGSQASAATSRFLDLASAASKVEIGAGRAAQVNPKLPKFADGGIATSPSIIGEAGPEAAIPLKNGSVPVTINGGIESGETNRLLREIQRESRRQTRTLVNRERVM